MRGRVTAVIVVTAVLFLGYTAFTTIDSKTSIATAAKPKYSATVYVAGMGGHFAKSNVTIDPNNADNPISLANLDRVVIGAKNTHATHDARLDNSDSNILFWSTYIHDPDGKFHVGKSDLKTGDVIKDIAMTPDPRATTKSPIYCASGQTKKSYMPVFMGSEGFIDVFDKGTMEKKHRVYVSDLGYKPGTYKFVHGTNSPDMKKFIVVLNQTGEDKKGNGKVDFILVDLPALEKGAWKVLAKNTLTGEPEKTLTFREYFRNDGNYIYQSAGDRLWVLDAATLKMVDEKMIPDEGQIHDAMPTPDDKYALLTVRALGTACDAGGEPLPGKSITDGVFMLYDADAKKLVGKAESTCQACHKEIGLGDKSAVLCGLDAHWKKM
jgi:hypothetical protein